MQPEWVNHEAILENQKMKDDRCMALITSWSPFWTCVRHFPFSPESSGYKQLGRVGTIRVFPTVGRSLLEWPDSLKLTVGCVDH